MCGCAALCVCGCVAGIVVVLCARHGSNREPADRDTVVNVCETCLTGLYIVDCVAEEVCRASDVSDVTTSVDPHHGMCGMCGRNAAGTIVAAEPHYVRSH